MVLTTLTCMVPPRILLAFSALLLSIFVWLLRSNNEHLICTKYLDGGLHCRPQCEKDGFALDDMLGCHPMLGCACIKQLKITTLLGQGAVKNVYQAELDGLTVAVNVLRDDRYRDDFTHGLEMLAGYQGNRQVSQLLGNCTDTNTYVTEYHPLGDASRLNDVLQANPTKDTALTRFRLCIQYIEILHLLHTGPMGTRIMCDSNDLHKTLTQFLLSNDLGLIVNDLDALPVVASGGVKCGQREIIGDFAAPEQLWDFDEDFDDARMSGYDEKTDIWKVPDVCDWFLGDFDVVKFHTFSVHIQCKASDPRLRPTAKDILHTYKHIMDKLSS